MAQPMQVLLGWRGAGTAALGLVLALSSSAAAQIGEEVAPAVPPAVAPAANPGQVPAAGGQPGPVRPRRAGQPARAAAPAGATRRSTAPAEPAADTKGAAERGVEGAESPVPAALGATEPAADTKGAAERGVEGAESPAPVALGAAEAAAQAPEGHGSGAAHSRSGHGAAAGHRNARAHGGHAEHVPKFSEINWVYGILGEKEGVEPDLLWRSKGMPVPFITTLFNWGVFIALVVMLAKKHLPGALTKRKDGIVRGIRDAAAMKEDSARRLEEYERKIEGLDAEIERLKEEMRQAGEQERSRILAEAAERRFRMERDARHLIEIELENASQELRRQVAERALANATERLAGRLSPQDHGRFVETALGSLKKLPTRSLGGRT